MIISIQSQEVDKVGKQSELKEFHGRIILIEYIYYFIQGKLFCQSVYKDLRDD